MHMLGDSEYFKRWPVLKAISVEGINIKLSRQVEKGEKIIPSCCYILCCFVIYIKRVYLCRSVCVYVYACVCTITFTSWCSRSRLLGFELHPYHFLSVCHTTIYITPFSTFFMCKPRIIMIPVIQPKWENITHLE